MPRQITTSRHSMRRFVLASHSDDAMVTIATFDTELEASFARGALQASGISALVPHRAELQVFESDRDRALVELRRLKIRIVPPQHRA